MRSVILYTISFIGICPVTFAQGIRFNEVMTENNIIPDSEGNFYPWIELSNTSSEAINLSAYTIQEDTIDGGSWTLPSISIDAGSFQFFWLSGEGASKGLLHSDFTIKSKRLAVLLLKNGMIVDSINFPFHPNTNESLSRNPLKQNEWVHCSGIQITFDSENSKPGFWKKIANKTSFNPRDSSPNASLIFNNKIWVLAGYRHTSIGWRSLSDVWCSEDGINWKLINANPPYSPYSAYMVFDGKMWAFDDKGCWSSKDGIDWTKEAALYPGGTGSRMVNFNGHLYFVSGEKIGMSVDAKNWTIINSNGPWGKSRLWPSFLVHNQKLFYMGGGINYLTGNDYYFNDVWVSENGVDWNLLTPNAEWPGRYWFNAISFDNKMWVLGGWNFHNYTNSEFGNQNDIWVSGDGIAWKEFKSSDVWPNRHSQFIWIKDNSLFISSGYGSGLESRMYNDVWVCDPKQDINITIPDILTYGDSNIMVTNSENVEIVPDKQDYLKVDNGKITSVKSGFVKIHISSEGDHIFYPFSGEQNLFIDKRSLIASTPDIIRLFGQPNPEFEINYSGFALNDSPDDLIERPVVSCEADESSYSGNYTISVSGGRSDNYRIIPMSGTLNIVPTDNLSPYPNPAIKQVTFSLPYQVSNSDQLTIFSSLGEKVVDESIQGSNVFIVRFDLDPGLYFYSIKNNNKLFQGKVLVEK